MRMWTRGLSLGLACVLGITSADAVAAPGAGLSPAQADLPIEASMTLKALEQIATLDKERVSYGLLLLEDLLQLDAHRAAAVNEALMQGNALSVLEGAAKSARSKTTKGVYGSVLEQVKERLSVAQLRAASPMKTTVAPTFVRRSELQWKQVSAQESWFALSTPALTELELYLKDCAFAKVELRSASGEKYGPSVLLSEFGSKRLTVPAGVTDAVLHVTKDGACANPFSVAGLERKGLALIKPSTTASSPLTVTPDSPILLAPDSTGDTFLSFQAEPGTIYRVVTYDLTGEVSTAMKLTSEGDNTSLNVAPTEQQFSSNLVYTSLMGGEVRVQLSHPRSALGAQYKFAVEAVHQFNVLDTVAASEEPHLVSTAVLDGGVVPLDFSNGPIHYEFNASRGSVFTLHGDVDISWSATVYAPIPVLRDPEVPTWRVRDSRTYMVSSDGRVKLTLSPREGSAGGLEFFQFLTSPNERPVPEGLRLPSSPRKADVFDPSLQERSDGGWIVPMKPGEEGWIRLPTSSGWGYQIYLDGVRETSLASLTVHDRYNTRRVLGSVVTRNGLADLYLNQEDRREVLLKVAAIEGREKDFWWLTIYKESYFNGLDVGDKVLVNQHREFQGERNWAEEMERYVGRRATVVEKVGRDTNGAWVVRLDIDNEEYLWRTRDLELVEHRR